MFSSRPTGTDTCPATGSGGAAPAGRPCPEASAATEKLHAMELLGSVPFGRLALSMRALPFLAVARHLVIEGGVVLRIHRGLGFHSSCDGSVVAYGADNFGSPEPDGTADLWSVQFTGPAEIVRPDRRQRDRFGSGPSEVNGEEFDPVYLRVEPHLTHMHTLGFDATPSVRTHSVT
ncbi:pyridoxamine 5'-phosphate oxidase family protein [Streptomyces sp. NPDC059166]|uniref:pyridoxamine 5'-phosphate oxidase family protein n=1 Tax=Streptomyces sp. NPDC059166 TaxID=3346752 RepID=UPI0036BBADC9